MDGRVRGVPKNLAEKVFTTPKTALPGVVASLTKGIGDQFMKAKVLHDWICDNIAYDADMYFSGVITAQDYESVLKKKKAVCSGYTNLMNEMCRLAGVESIGINGYSKGFGYTAKIGPPTDHAWNAVHIGGKWYLVDVTWDAGVMDRRTFIKRYSTEWLFLDSRPFLYSHLPEEKAYQFYAPVLSADQFMREAYISGKFFQYGLALKKDEPEYNNAIKGQFTFDVVMNRNDISLSSVLRTNDQQNVDAASWATRKGSTVTFDFDVPDANKYNGNLFARFNNDVQPADEIDIPTFEGDWLPKAEALYNVKNIKDRKITEKELKYFKASYFKVPDNDRYYFAEDQFDTARYNAVLKIEKLLNIPVANSLEDVLNFNIKAGEGYQGFGDGVLKYPYTFENYLKLPNTKLVSPIQGTLKAGNTQTFAISSKDWSSFAIMIDKQWNFFTRNSQTGNYELTLKIPDSLDTLEIIGSPTKTGTYWGLIRYQITKPPKKAAPEEQKTAKYESMTHDEIHGRA
jgi:hypothetical protein